MRAATVGDPALSARLLDHHGQRLTEMPLTPVEGACELTLPLGSLGPGDYVIELSAKATADAAQQYVAFRVMR